MEWINDRLGNVLEVKYGKDHKKLKDGQYPVYGSGGLMRHVDSKLFDGPSILIPRKGTLNNIMFVEKPFWTVDTMFWTKINGQKIDPLFLYYCICKKNFASMDVGSAVPSMTVSILNEIPISYPKKESDQRRIASLLSSLDRKIELNNKINAELEEMAQAIFKNWVSECSNEVTIGELSYNITDYNKTDVEKVVLINSSDVTDGFFEHNNYSPNKNLKGHFKKRFQKGDILYSQVRPRNRHWAYCNFDANDYLASTQLMVIRNNPSLITSILLYQYIISDKVWKEFTLKTETRSGTFPQGNYEDLSKIRVPYKDDIKNISKQLDVLYTKVYSLKRENEVLSQLRDTLLPKLMSGEIEIPE